MQPVTPNTNMPQSGQIPATPNMPAPQAMPYGQGQISAVTTSTIVRPTTPEAQTAIQQTERILPGAQAPQAAPTMLAPEQVQVPYGTSVTPQMTQQQYQYMQQQKQFQEQQKLMQTRQVGQSVQPIKQPSPMEIAQAQAQVLAQAIIQAQKIVNNAENTQVQTQAQTQAQPQAQPVAPAPQQAPARPTTSEKPTSGERVIQPIHDPTRDERRNDMERMMSELLGGDTGERTAINTNSAKNANKATAKMLVPNAAQASSSIPMPMTTPASQEQLVQQQMSLQANQQTAPLPIQQPTMPAPQMQQMAPVQQPVQVSQPQNIPVAFQMQRFQSVQDAATQVHVQAPAERIIQTPATAYQPSAPVNTSYQGIAAQMQAQAQAKADAERRQIEAAAAQAEQERAAAEAAALRAQQARAAQQAQQRKPLRVNPDVVKKAADASILESQKRRAAEPKKNAAGEEVVEAIRPAYITELEEDLAKDMLAGKQNGLAAQMAKELADDEITLKAKQIEVKPQPTPEELKAREVDHTPDFVLAAMQSNPLDAAANPNINPNIQGGA